MSHFVVLVAMEPDALGEEDRQAHAAPLSQDTPQDPIARLMSKNRDVEHLLSGIMEPFDENLQVEEHEARCGCCGFKCIQHIRKASDEAFPSWKDYQDQLREKMKDLPKIDLADEDAIAAREALRLQTWQEMVADKIAFEKKLRSEATDTDAPAPDCEECGGSGEVMTTYNSDAKWDWYEVGGRWTGLFADQDPRNDPKNQVPCDLCGASGIRDDWASFICQEVTELGSECGDEIGRVLSGDDFRRMMDGFHGDAGERLAACQKELKDRGYQVVYKDDWATQMHGCNGCHGKGHHLSFSLQPVPEDIIRAGEAKKKIAEQDIVPFAFIDLGGEWHEKSGMGWFGMSEDNDEWPKTFKELLKEVPDDAWLVVVDCHI